MVEQEQQKCARGQCCSFARGFEDPGIYFLV